jgi:hypothetical protein
MPILGIALFALGIGADRAGATVAALVLGFAAMAVVGRTIIDHSAAMGAARRALAKVELIG